MSIPDDGIKLGMTVEFMDTKCYGIVRGYGLRMNKEHDLKFTRSYYVYWEDNNEGWHDSAKLRIVSK